MPIPDILLPLISMINKGLDIVRKKLSSEKLIIVPMEGEGFYAFIKDDNQIQVHLPFSVTNQRRSSTRILKIEILKPRGDIFRSNFYIVDRINSSESPDNVIPGGGNNRGSIDCFIKKRLFIKPKYKKFIFQFIDQYDKKYKLKVRIPYAP